MLGRTNVGRSPNLTTLTVTPTDSSQTITPGSGYDGFSSVTVEAIPYVTATLVSKSVSSTSIIFENSNNITEVKEYSINVLGVLSELANNSSHDLFSVSSLGGYYFLAKKDDSTLDLICDSGTVLTVTVTTSEITMAVKTNSLYCFNTDWDYYVTILGKTS